MPKFSKVVPDELVPEPRIKSGLAIVAGALLAGFIVAVGLELFSIGRFNNAPYGNEGQIILLITLATSFGYDLGLALKSDSEVPEKKVYLFWAAFLGTFFGLIIAAGVLSAYFGAPLTALYPVAILVLGTGAFSAIIQSEVVEHSRMRFLKRGLDTFSNKIATGVFGGYATATFSDQLTGAIVGAVFLLISFIVPPLIPWLQEKVKWMSLTRV